MPYFPKSLRTVFWLVVAVSLNNPRSLRAEDKVAYKYQLYQEGEGRIRVEVNNASLDKDLDPAGKLHLRLHGVLDAIAGATPSGEPSTLPGGPVPMSHMVEHRKAWDAELTRTFSNGSLATSFSNSRESDYVSNGGALNSTFDFNSANTQLLLGAGATRDQVKVYFQPDWLRKRSASFIAGVSQIIDARTSISLNLNYGRESGYLSDPYRMIQKITEILPGLTLPLTFNENRPPDRDEWVLLARINREFPSARAAIETSFRAYRDNWGINSATLETGWYQKIGSKLIVVPSLRLYRQSAADFYRLNLNGSGISPTQTPSASGPFYSADYRLSKLETTSLGMKLVWTPIERLQLDLAYERYSMRGLDGLTSSYAYPRAGVTTVGIQRTW